MTATTFAPGPSPTTVGAADGTILTAPEGWVLLPPGSAGLTRRVKAAGDHWVVQEKRGRKTFSRGLWAPEATIERIRAELEAERSTEGYARRQEVASRRREAVQSEPIGQSVSEYRGMVVVTEERGSLLSESRVHGRPSVNDLATILANAMRRPLEGKGRRPTLVRLRGHHQWRELFPVLKELGVEVSVERDLPGIEEAYEDHLRRLRDEHRSGMVKPSDEQAKVEAMFPAIARYVDGYGYIEIGDQEGFGFVVRAIGYGGLDIEDDRPDTLAEAMAVLEAGLVRWFEEEAIEPDKPSPDYRRRSRT
jgi:hypothetical protein